MSANTATFAPWISAAHWWCDGNRANPKRPRHTGRFARAKTGDVARFCAMQSHHHHAQCPLPPQHRANHRKNHSGSARWDGGVARPNQAGRGLKRSSHAVAGCERAVARPNQAGRESRPSAPFCQPHIQSEHSSVAAPITAANPASSETRLPLARVAVDKHPGCGRWRRSGRGGGPGLRCR